MQVARLINWIILITGVVMIVRQSATIWRIWKAGDKLTIAKAELVEAQAEQERLKEKLVQVQSPEFVEREARDKLGYARENEIILILPSSAPAPSVQSPVTQLANWEKWKQLYFE